MYFKESYNADVDTTLLSLPLSFKPAFPLTLVSALECIWGPTEIIYYACLGLKTESPLLILASVYCCIQLSEVVCTDDGYVLVFKW